MTRDAVRMLVAHRGDGTLVHSHFSELPRFLDEGDLIVVNTSGTLAAAVPGRRPGRSPSSRCTSPPTCPPTCGRWNCASATSRGSGPSPGRSSSSTEGDGSSSWRLTPPTPAACGSGSRRSSTPEPLHTYLAVHGHPIRYGYVRGSWPISTYQNVYATEPGSAEMPSAGRPFTPEVLTRLVARGVGVVAHRAAHRRGVARGLRTALPRVLPGDTRHRAPRQRHPARRWTGDRHRHDRGARPRDGGGRPRRGARRQRVDRHGGDARAPGHRRWTVCSPGGTSPRRRTSPCWRPIAGRALLERSYAAALVREVSVARIRRRASDPAVTDDAARAAVWRAVEPPRRPCRRAAPGCHAHHATRHPAGAEAQRLDARPGPGRAARHHRRRRAPTTAAA